MGLQPVGKWSFSDHGNFQRMRQSQKETHLGVSLESRLVAKNFGETDGYSFGAIRTPKQSLSMKQIKRQL